MEKSRPNYLTDPHHKSKLNIKIIPTDNIHTHTHIHTYTYKYNPTLPCPAPPSTNPHHIIKLPILSNKLLILNIILNTLLDLEHNLMIVGHILIIPDTEYFPVFYVRLPLHFLDYGQLFLFVLLAHQVFVDLGRGFC